MLGLDVQRERDWGIEVKHFERGRERGIGGYGFRERVGEREREREGERDWGLGFQREGLEFSGLKSERLGFKGLKRDIGS